MITVVDASHGMGLYQRFVESHRSLPGQWSGFDQADLAYLARGAAPDTRSNENWMRNKLFDAAWERIRGEAVYTCPEGRIHTLRFLPDGALVLAPLEGDAP